MRYRILFLAFFLTFQLKAGVNMTTVRTLFSTASESETACSQLHAMTATGTLSKDPVLFAYHAAAEIIKANHAVWPQQKLAHFNAGKALLEKAIEKYPNDVEMRYIRYCVQRGCPFFLGYSSDKASDRKYVLANLDRTGWPEDYKKKVRNYLNSPS
jgi:hypothetical protein